VAQADGSPVENGAIIESVCGGRIRKETYVDSSGGFAFQSGVKSNVFQDASDDSPQSTGGLGGNIGRPLFGTAGSEFSGTPELSGCELRARLSGYRSSVVSLDNMRSLGELDVGTLVLYPIAKVQGTTVSVTSMQAPKDARKALSRAQVELQKKDPNEAEKHLKKALQAYPRFAEAWLVLGNLHQGQHRLNDARTDYKSALEADANFVKPYIELGRMASLEKNWVEAASITDKAMLLDPVDFPEGYLINSLAKYSLEKTDEAEASALKARRLDGMHRFPLVHLILAGVHERKKDLVGAVAELREYLKYAPDSSNAGQVRTRIEELERQSANTASILPEPH
jgi:tetratricopeptide (TPR) repeat protein